jgi:hypothetical protein
MPAQRIGNWEITKEGISWKGQPDVKYSIPTERLTECGPGERANMYDWLVHLPEKTWLTETDVYSLNTALIYAIELSGRGFPSNLSFVETFKEQQKLLRTR